MKFTRLDRLAWAFTALALTVGAPAGSADDRDGTWTSLDGFGARAYASMGYDAPRQRFVVFGGRSAGGANPAVFSDAWAFDPLQKSWTALRPLGLTPTRYSALSAMDSLHHRLVVFGGQDGVVTRSDVWTLTLDGTARWDSIPISGGPGPRSLGVAVYDPVRDRILVTAGLDASSNAQSDVWELRIDPVPTWTALAPTGDSPPISYSGCGVYDPVRDRMLYYVVGDTSQVFALSLGDSPSWQLLATVGAAPEPRLGAVMDYDPTQDRLVLHGGFDPYYNAYHDDTRALSLSGTPTWSRLTAITTAYGVGRAWASGGYDPVGEQFVMIGGVVYNGDPPAHIRSTVLTLSMAPASTWNTLTISAGTHYTRVHAASAYDPNRHQMLILGGYVLTNDVDVLDVSGSPVWSQWSTGTGPPTSLVGASAAYDAARDRMYVFAGSAIVGQYLNTVWLLDRGGAPVWNAVAPSGSPPPARSDASMVLDAANDRLIVYGGRDNNGPYSDVWALSLGDTPAWTELLGSSPAGARYGHSAVVDAAGGRMLVYGGSPSSGSDPWAMSLSDPSAWTLITPSGTPPPTRDYHTAVLDQSRRRMLVYGGEWNGVPFGDLWSLSLTGSPTWTALSPTGPTPTARYGHVAAWSPDLDGMLVADGQGGTFTLQDAWLMNPNSLVAVPEPHSGNQPAGLEAPRPNPARGSAVLSFALARAGDARLEVFDLAGRRVRVLVSGTMTAGPHETRWDLRDEGGRTVPAGVYLARLTAPGASGVRRFVVLR